MPLVEIDGYHVDLLLETNFGSSWIYAKREEHCVIHKKGDAGCCLCGNIVFLSDVDKWRQA